MSQPTLQLVSAADAKFFPGLLVSMGSTLASASGNFNYSITVLDGGISVKDWATMESCLQRIGKQKGLNVELRRMDTTGTLVDGMPSRRGSSLTFARLAIPFLIEAPKVVYLDSDVVCLRGVEEFWTSINADNALVASRDPLGKLARDPLTRQLPISKYKLPYFNAGIIGMNLERWRDIEIQSKINKLLTKSNNLRYADQSLLNFVFHNEWLELPYECNQLLTLANCGEIATTSELTNYHYIGKHKPWLSTVSKFYRKVPDLLFDQMYHWICTSNHDPKRSICPRSLVRARRKRLIYQFFSPARARQYAAALALTKSADRVVNRLWENWQRAFKIEF